MGRHRGFWWIWYSYVILFLWYNCMVSALAAYRKVRSCVRGLKTGKMIHWQFLLSFLHHSWREIFLFLHVATVQPSCMIAAGKRWTQSTWEKASWSFGDVCSGRLPGIHLCLTDTFCVWRQMPQSLRSFSWESFLVCPCSARCDNCGCHAFEKWLQVSLQLELFIISYCAETSKYLKFSQEKRAAPRAW